MFLEERLGRKIFCKEAVHECQPDPKVNCREIKTQAVHTLQTFLYTSIERMERYKGLK